VTETIRCPFCSAKYDLRRERTRKDVKRARCLRCGNDFSIGEAVSLLFGGSEEILGAPQSQDKSDTPTSDTASFTPEEIQAAIASSMTAPTAAAAPTETTAETPSKLKIRKDGELLENLTKEEVTAMAEDGRLKGNHTVAHQFSENWLEAAKVPFLRPIFAKLRPPKRGLFEGLFGRN
jgi:hypothetical protein